MKVVDVIQHGKYGVLDEGGSTLEFLALPNEADPRLLCDDRHDSRGRLRPASQSS